MTADELIRVMEAFKAHGLTHLKTQDIELGSGPETLKPLTPSPVPELKTEQIVVPQSPFDDLSEDEIKYWHSPYFNELQAKKEAQKERLARGE